MNDIYFINRNLLRIIGSKTYENVTELKIDFILAITQSHFSCK